MIHASSEVRCDGCGAVVDTNVQPRVIIIDTNAIVPLDFCSYSCLAGYALKKHDEFEALRRAHLSTTIAQLNATLARAYELEQNSDSNRELGEYVTVASVPLHPLVELVPGKPPTVKLKVS